MSVFDWSTTAGSNGNSDSSINFVEGQAPSTVNDSARALMARVAHWLNMLGANVTMGGASNAYTFTSGETLTAYAAGMRFLWSPNADSTGAVTLNVDAIGAKKVYMPDGTQAGSGDLDADSYYDVVYDASLDSSNGGFKIVGFPDTTLTAGDYLTVSNNLSDLNSASTALTNLGVSAFAKTILDDADAAAVRTTIGAGTGAGDLVASNNLSDVANAATARGNIAAYGAGDNASFGTLAASGDTTIGTNALFVDVSADRVGVGTISPAGGLHVYNALDSVTDVLIGEVSGGFSNGAGMSLRRGGTELGNVSADYFNGLVFKATTGSGAAAVEVGSFTTAGDFNAVNAVIANAKAVASVSGSLTAATHGKGQVNAITGNVTMPNLGAGAHGLLSNDSAPTRTITASGITMYVNGVSVASATIAARGLVGFVFPSTGVCVLSGDVY